MRGLKRTLVKKTCRHCQHPVGGGGDQHARDRCPPKYDPLNNRVARKKRARARKQREQAERVARGTPVAGTGRPPGDSDRNAEAAD